MRITVAIPSYRRPADLRRSLESLTLQERPVDEIIVVVREGDNETEAAAQEFLGSLPLRIEHVILPGMVVANNRALEAATGDIIAYIDDDANPHPDWARKLEHGFASDPELAGLGGRDHIFERGHWLEGNEPVVGIVSWFGRAIGHHHLGVGPQRDVDILKGVNMAYRMRSVGALRFDPRLRGTGAQAHCDMKFSLDLRVQGKRLAYDPSILVDHFPAARHDEDQRNVFNPVAYGNDIYNLTLAFLEYLPVYGRLAMLVYALGIGTGSNYFGLLQGLRFWPKLGNTTWQKVAVSFENVLGARKDWRKTTGKDHFF